MRNIVHSRPGATFTYWTPNGDRSVTLGHDDVVAILTDSAGEVVEWFTSETPLETVTNFATDAADMHFVDFDNSVVRAAVSERNLWADCFDADMSVVTF